MRNIRYFTKKILSSVFGSSWLYRVYRLSRKSGYVIAVTFHDTPEGSMQNFKKQIEWFSANFSDCSLDDLDNFISTGVWGREKPGLILTFDDGLASNYLYALELLEEFGFTGWFMVPAATTSLQKSDQFKFATEAKMDFSTLQNTSRLFLTDHELCDLKKRGHEIVAHSYSHIRLSEDLSASSLFQEVNYSKQILEKILDCDVECFAWVGGEEYSYSASAMRAIRNAGYEYVFATNCAPISAEQNKLALERYHLEPDYSLAELRFAISPIYTIAYMPKRKRIEEKIFE